MESSTVLTSCYSSRVDLVLPAYSCIGSQCGWNGGTGLTLSPPRVSMRENLLLPHSLGQETSLMSLSLPGRVLEGPLCLLKTALTAVLPDGSGIKSALAHQVLNSRATEAGHSWVPVWGCGVGFGPLNSEDPRFRQAPPGRNTAPWVTTVTHTGHR